MLTAPGCGGGSRTGQSAALSLAGTRNLREPLRSRGFKPNGSQATTTRASHSGSENTRRDGRIGELWRRRSAKMADEMIRSGLRTAAIRRSYNASSTSRSVWATDARRIWATLSPRCFESSTNALAQLAGRSNPISTTSGSSPLPTTGANVSLTQAATLTRVHFQHEQNHPGEGI